MSAYVLNGDLLRALLFLALPLCICSTTSMAMNDTDAVVAEGLFPMEDGLPLALKSEKVTVLLHPNGLKVMRRYEIQNTGDASLDARLATTCLSVPYNDDKVLSTLYEGAYVGTMIAVDGNPVQLQRHVGRLVDDGTRVILQERTMSQIGDCEQHNDGDICGHPWVSLPVTFGSDQIRTVEVNYEVPDFSPRFVEFTLDRLQLYAEKFWGSDSVRVIEFDFSIEGKTLGEDVFLPRGEYAAHSTEPRGYKEGTFTWRIEQYSPSRKTYTYFTRLVHSRAIELEAISKAYRSILKPSSPSLAH